MFLKKVLLKILMLEQPITISILAGGASRRFKTYTKQSDKALAVINDRIILERILTNLAPVASRINIVTNNFTRQQYYIQILSSLAPEKLENSIKQKIHWLIDSPLLTCSGPLQGAITSMLNNFIINVTVPCDVPFLSSEVITTLRAFLGKNISTVVPIWSNGRLEPQIAAYRKEQISTSIDGLTSLKRSRIDDLIRASSKIAFVNIEKTFSLFGSVDQLFANINRPEAIVKWEKKEQMTPLSSSQNYYLSKENNFHHYSQIVQILKNDQKYLLANLKRWVSQNKSKNQLNNLLELANNFFSKELYFWAGVTFQLLRQLEYSKEFEEAQKNAYIKEMNFWERHKIYFLSLHAAQDVLIASSKDIDEGIIEKLEKYRFLMKMKREDKK
ncbi:MAG: molybdenum cofactor guanylyltransferase [Candidatus Hermodarchaeota archaeon]